MVYIYFDTGKTVTVLYRMKNLCKKCPHLLFPQFLDDNSPQEREKGIEMGLELLKHCEEMWVFGSEVTDGMKKEIDMATKLGMPITYRDWGENQCIFTQTI